MFIKFLILFVFVFIAVLIMVIGLYFSKYKQSHKKKRIIRAKKISVSCSACPGSVSKACNGH